MRRSFFPYDRWIETRRHWPDTAEQSTENPLQEDRLPDSSAIELEYAAIQYTPKQNFRFSLKQFAIAALFCIQFFVYEHIFNFIFMWVHCILTTASLAAFLFAASTKPRGFWLWAVIFLLFPPIVLLSFSFRDPSFSLLIAALTALYLADQFAKHHFFLHTTVPVPASTAKTLRFLWWFRFFPLFNKPAGFEFYGLPFFIVVYLFLHMLALLPKVQTGHYLISLSVFLPAMAVLPLSPFFIEPVVAFLSKRPYIGPLRTLRHFYYAVISWFTYNRRMIRYPGTFQSPAGTSRARCWMAIACIALFSSGVTSFFSRHRDRIRTTPPSPQVYDKQGNLVWPIPKQPIQPEHELTWQQRISRHRYRREKIAAGEEDPFPENTPPPPENVQNIQLEPYQTALFERMSPEEKNRYLKHLATRDLPPPEVDIWAPLVRMTDEADIDSPMWRLSAYIIYAADYLSIVPYFIISLVFPPVLMLSCIFVVTARSIAYAGENFGSHLPVQEANNPALSGTVARMRASQDARERESLFLGTNAYDGMPVIVPRSVFNEHAHLLGDSGSGKTSLGMTTLINQLIQFGDSSLVVIDLEADDLALFEATREAAEQVDAKLKAHNPDARYPFRWFTNEMHRSTYAFNILTQTCFESLTPYQRADILTLAMGLQYGTDYGRAYFADANIEMLHQALAENPFVSSFIELNQILSRRQSLRMTSELRRAASHLHAVISRLASCQPINAVNPSEHPESVLENAIDLVDVFMTPQVLYFHLPSLVGTTSSAEIARFVVHLLLASSKTVGPKRKQVYLFIDEFQRITAANLEIILQTARSMNVGVILANQTMSDLKQPGVDLVSAVEANTRYRQIFAASDLAALRQIVESSGETIIHSRAWTEYLGAIGVFGGGWGRTYAETISPRLRANDVILASDHPLQSILYIRRGKDFAQFGGFPFVLTSSHSVDQEVYERRKNASWPEGGEGTLCPTQPGTPPPKSPSSVLAQCGADPILEDTPATDSPQVPSQSVSDLGEDATDDKTRPNAAPSRTSSEQPDDPLDQGWKEVQTRRKQQKRKKRPQDKYRKQDSPSSDSEKGTSND